MQTPSVGRSVHYVLANGEHRPAEIVRVWPDVPSSVNLQITTDGEIDRDALIQSGLLQADERVPSHVHSTRVPYASADVAGIATGTWHWPERVPTEHEAAVAASV